MYDPLLVSSPPSVFDDLYRREAIDAVLAPLLPPELSDLDVAALRGNGFMLREDLESVESTLKGAVRGVSGRAPLVVELGCGSGGISRRLRHSLAVEVIGLDISSVAIDLARQRASEDPTRTPPRFLVADFVAVG